MTNHEYQKALAQVLKHMPPSWLGLTTHRLDRFNESLAKVEFIQELEKVIESGEITLAKLNALPTAFDYIRLGHPLSCVLEWTLAQKYQLDPAQVISFSSRVMPILAILRKNLLAGKKTRILYLDSLPACFDLDILHEVYDYEFDAYAIQSSKEIQAFEGSTIYVSSQEELASLKLAEHVDFFLSTEDRIGSVLFVLGEENKPYISSIQHVRRRESIAMTPANCALALHEHIGDDLSHKASERSSTQNQKVIDSIAKITGSPTPAILGSSGLSIQYAIMMGLVHYARVKHPNKAIKFIVPPNCYGGTNDQARRVAAAVSDVEILDLAVDSGKNMESSLELILDQVAQANAIPYIIAEIPTNPRVEVPDLIRLEQALSKQRLTSSGEKAVRPVFILDQTFCPNYHFLGPQEVLASIEVVAYVSGSKFPSGGLCTAGYGVANERAQHYMPYFAKHLHLCDNEATALQIDILAKQMPSMNDRIQKAYENTKAFVQYIKKILPEVKINFVSDELAKQGFTPSVFSLDLPTKGETHAEQESYKRQLNERLIQMMVKEIPHESKHCVSYGQLQGCYWTIPATSTQGTTKEDDKDYIARVSCSPIMDVERHQKVFQAFVNTL